ncbi:unnamed protein product [Rhodiola kirilowii]
MANHGAGNKFVSVNLNKSYGKLSGPSNLTYGAGRGRLGGQVVGGGVGGGMVVLSRPRSSQKTGQKLSVPSPVNLPSMRKEHEKFDSSGAGSGSAGGAAGSSARPSSAGMGWSKPATIVLQEKEKNTETPSDVVAGTISTVDGASRGASVYMPPARLGNSADVTGSSQLKVYTPVEKVAILRGEDFPSLHTSLSTGPGHTHKQKDGGSQKSKQVPVEDLSINRRDTANVGEVGVHLQGHTSHHNIGYGPPRDDFAGQRLGGLRSHESQKQERYFHGSLPEVRLNSRSDWADDERDTGHVLTDRSQNHGSLNNEGYWDRDFEMPRGSFMPNKPAPNVFNKWGQRDSETGKVLSSEVFKADPYKRDGRPTSKEGRDRNSWNTFNTKREMSNDNRFVAPFSHDHDKVNSFNDRSFDRKNSSFVGGGRQGWSNTVEPTDQFEGNQFQRHRSNNLQNGSSAKSTLSFGGRGPINDPILNFSKVKKPPSDPFTPDAYDGSNSFSGELLGVVKRKKEVPKLAEFHDPARESFEAELERVQKMQEQERQRAIEEQERAMELAQREEEERLRLAKEQEEMKRRLEEEARETAWRAGQEQLEAIQKAEVQRIAREEEKQRMQMEEERRKQAAKQMLLELEEKIARRQAEATREDAACSVDGTSGPGKEKETSRAADISDWEDGERMVERITTSASSDSSGLNRFVDSGSRHHSFTDNYVLPSREKSIHLQRRETYENAGSSNFILHNQDSDHHTTGRDIPFHAKKSLPRADAYGGSGFTYPHNYPRSGVHDPDMIDSVGPDRFTEKLGDGGWGGSSSSHQTQSIYQERTYQNPELGEVYSYSRSRYSMRQPRVLPPPSISSINRTFNRGEIEHPGLSPSHDRVVNSNRVSDSALQTAYGIVPQENIEDPEMVTLRPGHAATREQISEVNNSIRCDSQSSLSVSSPPTSPTLLSHEDVEDSRDTPDSSADAGDKIVSSSTPAADDEWMVENHKNLQEQEVYDEGGEYQEGVEVHEEQEDIDSNEEFEALNLEEKDSPRVSENLILGFNEGIEVEMPSDESEGNQNEKSKIFVQQSFGHAYSEENDGNIMPRSSNEMQMSDELIGDLAIQPNVDPPKSIGSVKTTVSSSQPLPTFAIPPVSRMVTSSMAALPNRPEAPVRLQFGLFSSPALIPSPVPSIQIGSIQMPLHLHPPVGSSFPHQSGPLFHFGQLAYNSPISQGLLPLAPQSISSIQLGMPGQFDKSNTAITTSVQHQESTKESKGLLAGGHPSSRNTKETGKRLGFDVGVDGYLKHDSAPSDPISSADGGQLQSRIIPPHQFSRERGMVRSKAPGSVSGGRGRGNFSTSRSFGSRSSVFASVPKSQGNSQHGENQVRDKADRRVPNKDDKMSFGLGGARISSRIDVEKDIDVTLQSGVVRVYDQPGIETPSDEDDFIEVRSKRQMLNDRREQREKDSKAKFGVTKNIRKPRPTSQNIQAPRNSNRLSSSLGRGPPNDVQSSFVATEGKSRVNAEVSAGLISISVSQSQPLAPIGTPTHHDGHFETRSRAIKPVQANGHSIESTGGKSAELESTYENRSNAMENVEASLGPWNNVWVSQQAMPLTQSQLDDAMKPVQFDAHGSSSGKPSGSIGIPVSYSSGTMKDKPFSSSASPVNSLLAGKKIQFGAVTSPTILPPSSRAVSQGIGSLGSARLEQVSHELSASGNTCSFFNGSEKRPEEPTRLEVSKSEAAAPSAVAVVTTATNDVLGTVAGHSSSVSESKKFGQAARDGENNDQKKSRNESKTEESLSVSLPADLSIEMSPISGWQPLQSPQNASHHMLSHFPGGHAPPFPFYEMNPMAGGPIFAFGPHHNASGSQTQLQKNSTTEPGPLGPWQQHRSGADSFYGHPAGFAPFISQQVGIPGAQGPPHMVVYNHFAPVGQFGQVGLSFMGTAYVPSEKQPDWKHNPTSSAMDAGEENVNNMGINSGQHISHGVPAPVQHLAPGSSLLQVAPPLAMFDVSPYRQSSDMSGPARWSPVPPHHLHPIPQLLPLQPHPERLMHSQTQLSNGPAPADKSTVPTTHINNKFPDSTSSATSSQFPSELGLVESSNPAPFSPVVSKENNDTMSDAQNISSSQSQNVMSTKSRSQQRKNVPFQQHSHSMGYNNTGHSRGSSSQKSVTGSGEWPNRRTGYHSRNQPSGTNKGFQPAKVKQIYVPKQPSN